MNAHGEKHTGRREEHARRRQENSGRGRRREWFTAADRRRSVSQGLVAFARSLYMAAPVYALLLFFAPVLLAGCYLLEPVALRFAQRMARRQRELLKKEFGVAIEEGYRPEPVLESLPDGRFRYGGKITKREPGSLRKEFRWVNSDTAIRSDLLWLLCAPLLGAVAAAPVGLVGYGLLGMCLALPGHGTVSPFLWHLYGWLRMTPRGDESHSGYLVLLVMTMAGVPSSPYFLRTYLNWSARLLTPPENARLTQRVRRLTDTRADAVDSQAAELRRIERDLHDGVQARLVAMGLNLGAVEQLMENDPAAARTLLAQSRETSETALRELRGLVRGIHPPVLAERGLADAIRALALDSQLEVEVAWDLPGRAEPAVESAVYFAVSELLTNAVRHAEARHVRIDLRHTGEALRVEVTDDGHGGADPHRGSGSGLSGIERRLGTFDGVLAVSSPRGGPTIVTLELPCALSSPRISTSSERA